MGPRRAMPLVLSDDLDESRRFYEDVLGLEVGMQEEGMLMLRSRAHPTTQVLLVARTGPCMDPAARDVAFSTEVPDADAAHAAAVEAGLEIVRPLADEPWGVRRFFVREPSGLVVNVAQHL